MNRGLHPAAGQAPPLLEAQGLGLRRKGTWIFRNVSFALAAGGSLAVMGESGVGKSTLLGLVLGLEKPTEGEVHFSGMPWSSLPERQRRPRRGRIQGVLQEAKGSLPPHLTAREILAEAASVHLPKPVRLEAICGAARRAGFPEGAMGHCPGALSGGMAQRLALARALVPGPDLLVLDEPFSALDGPRALDLTACLEALRSEGMAILVALHHPGLARRLGDVILTLSGSSPFREMEGPFPAS